MTADKIRAAYKQPPGNESDFLNATVEIAAQLADLNSYLRFFVEERQAELERLASS